MDEDVWWCGRQGDTRDGVEVEVGSTSGGMDVDPAARPGHTVSARHLAERDDVRVGDDVRPAPVAMLDDVGG